MDFGLPRARCSMSWVGAQRPSSGRWRTGSQIRSVATITMRSIFRSGTS